MVQLQAIHMIRLPVSPNEVRSIAPGSLFIVEEGLANELVGGGAAKVYQEVKMPEPVVAFTSVEVQPTAPVSRKRAAPKAANPAVLAEDEDSQV